MLLDVEDRRTRMCRRRAGTDGAADAATGRPDPRADAEADAAAGPTADAAAVQATDAAADR